MSQCTEAVEATRAESDFGVRWYADLMQGYLDLALAPWTAAASVIAESAEEAQAASTVVARPKRPRRGH